jgi:hypothetical protein
MNRWLASILLLLGNVTNAGAHDMTKARTTEEARVFEFYDHWYRLPERKLSCCGGQDCHIVKVKLVNNVWLFRDPQQQAWREIPTDRIEGESDRADTRESPDGNSHVCYNRQYVLCAVLGSGQ